MKKDYYLYIFKVVSICQQPFKSEKGLIRTAHYTSRGHYNADGIYVFRSKILKKID